MECVTKPPTKTLPALLKELKSNRARMQKYAKLSKGATMALIAGPVLGLTVATMDVSSAFAPPTEDDKPAPGYPRTKASIGLIMATLGIIGICKGVFDMKREASVAAVYKTALAINTLRHMASRKRRGKEIASGEDKDAVANRVEDALKMELVKNEIKKEVQREMKKKNRSQTNSKKLRRTRTSAVSDGVLPSIRSFNDSVREKLQSSSRRRSTVQAAALPVDETPDLNDLVGDAEVEQAVKDAITEEAATGTLREALVGESDDQETATASGSTEATEGEEDEEEATVNEDEEEEEE
eukprot:GHVT01047846.1.p1 GENE.GHVT01047846.1~~GHVT01047846.1.p1  ORF type:complete len:297 (+),score=68.94 GHVT01047846.1:3246-4136(+)